MTDKSSNEQSHCTTDELRTHVTECARCGWDEPHSSLLLRAANEIDRLQAKIDALMLEFCPDEMSKQQLEEWGRHQQPHETTALPIRAPERHALYVASQCREVDATARKLLREMYDRAWSPTETSVEALAGNPLRKALERIIEHTAYGSVVYQIAAQALFAPSVAENSALLSSPPETTAPLFPEGVFRGKDGNLYRLERVAETATCEHGVSMLSARGCQKCFDRNNAQKARGDQS